MGAQLEVFQDAGGEHRFNVHAANGEIVGVGEGYTRAADAERGFEALAYACTEITEARAAHRVRQVAELAAGRAAAAVMELPAVVQSGATYPHDTVVAAVENSLRELGFDYVLPPSEVAPEA